MSKKSKQKRATIEDTAEIPVERYEPDWENTCQNCGESPTVLGVDKGGKVVLATEMCGVCTWGESDALDPANW